MKFAYYIIITIAMIAITTRSSMRVKDLRFMIFLREVGVVYMVRIESRCFREPGMRTTEEVFRW